MRDEVKYQEREYYKVVLVALKPDSYRILQGPEEEKRLIRSLTDDYHVSRYEKMIKLVVREMIEEGYREEFVRTFSLANLQREFRQGSKKVAFSYVREINGSPCPVSARVYPRVLGKQRELEEFMMYVSFEWRN